MVWTIEEKKFLNKLNSPIKIQNFLNSLSYDVKGGKTPRQVIKHKEADCYSGALFAAAALQYHNYKPLLIELCVVRDDGHMLALFKKHKSFGAIAKSNFTTLTYREPVYKTVRELIMSYFDFYFNILGEKSLRKYSAIVNLEKLNHRKWQVEEKALKWVDKAFDDVEYHSILTPKMVRNLVKVNKRLLAAGLLGSNPKGLYKPKRKKVK